MKYNRKKIEKYVLANIPPIVKGESNKHMTEVYTNMFKKMTDKEFDIWMDGIESGEYALTVIVSNDTDLDIEHLLALADKQKIKLYHYLTYEGVDGMSDFTPAIKTLVMDSPISPLSQTLDKKISVATDSKSRDLMTGQVTGKSKSLRFTQPEADIVSANGLNSSLNELLTFRAGEEGGMRAFRYLMDTRGDVSQNMIKEYEKGTRSTKTLKALFHAAQMDITFD